MKNLSPIINGLIYKSVTKAFRKFISGGFYRFICTGLLIVLLSSFSYTLVSCNQNDKAELEAIISSDEVDKAVLEAFDLRINGKVDEAKNMLQNILTENSTNAMAHFELARTLNYIHLRGSKEADYHLELALKYDPENIIYNYYHAGICFLKAYIAIHSNQENTKQLVDNACEEYLKVLQLKPDYAEALMYLVEIYGFLPENMGGNTTKAENYTSQLENMDSFYGAKARLVVLPEGTDMIEYWLNYINTNGEDSKTLKELGTAYIFNDDIAGAQNCFEKAMAKDHSQNIRLLDLARYHMMKVMQNRERANEELPKAESFIEEYLDSTPEPIPSLKAYALGMLVKSKMLLGDKEAAEKLTAEAKALDPYYSGAFGIPSLSIFEPPTQLNHHFSSFFSPF